MHLIKLTSAKGGAEYTLNSSYIVGFYRAKEYKQEANYYDISYVGDNWVVEYEYTQVETINHSYQVQETPEVIRKKIKDLGGYENE